MFQKKSVDNRQKMIFDLLHKAIGMTPKVSRYYDERETSCIDVYIGVDRPDRGLTTYGTIGLSDYSIGLVSKDGKELRIELISMCSSDCDWWPNVISTCAFAIINSHFSCRPGAVFPNVVAFYDNDLEMKHVYFTTPFEWRELKKMKERDRITLWLMAIPISEQEYRFLEERGEDAFETLLEANDVEYYNPRRKSLI